ncbi:kit ligand precursor-like, partial [Scleropages formosus]
KQNIPKDYKITVRHIPKEVSGMCWVVLNVFHLEESLKDLAQKFGNISSNRDNIDIYVQTLQDESTMEEFQCHYREERWPTEEYFDYVKDLLNAANSKNESRGCESPLCPSATTEANMSEPHAMVGCNELVPNCSAIQGAEGQVRQRTGSPQAAPLATDEAGAEHQYLPKIVEKSLLWMLIIPLAMGLLCLVWKISCRRRREEPEPNPDSGHVLTDIEGKAAPLHGQLSGHKIRLSMEMV